MLRIALVTSELAPYHVSGGIGQYVNRLAQGLAVRGHAVTVAGVGIHAETEIDHGTWRSVSIERLAPSRLGRLGVPSFDEARATGRYLAAARGHFDVIETQNCPGYGAFVDAAGTPYVVRLVTPLGEHTAPERPSRIPRPRMAVATWLERRTVRHARRLLSSSRYMLASAQQLYGAAHMAADIVPFGIPDVGALPAPGGARLKFVVVGRAERRKGTDVLIAALDLAVAAVDVDVVFVGGNVSAFAAGDSLLAAAWERIRARSGLRIEETGAVDDLRRDTEIATSHWLLATSRFESFGLTVPEAMRCGTPAMVSAGGALPEVSASSPSNIVYGPADDANALAAAIIAAVRRGPSDALERRAAVRAAYLQHFTLDRFIDRSLDAYDQAIAATSGRR